MNVDNTSVFQLLLSNAEQRILQVFSFTVLLVRGCRGTRSLERTEPIQLTRAAQKGILHHMASCEKKKQQLLNCGDSARGQCCSCNDSISQWRGIALSNTYQFNLFFPFLGFSLPPHWEGGVHGRLLGVQLLTRSNCSIFYYTCHVLAYTLFSLQI